jgi:hypothetical protein
MDGHEIYTAYVDGGVGGNHLQFHTNSPQMFERAGCASSTITDCGEGRAYLFLIINCTASG